MRTLFAAALLALGLAAAAPAHAADPVEAPGEMGYGGRAFSDFRAEPVLIYDYQPGVLVRTWWLSPWHHRHYFPATGKRPRVGRRENLTIKTGAIKPAATFYRSWSTSDLIFDETPRPLARPPAHALDDDGIPRRRKTPAKP